VFRYEIKNVASETELENALTFAKSVFKDSGKLDRPTFFREFWLKRMPANNDFMLYVKDGEELIGMVFGYVESNNSITLATVAASTQYRNQGIASSLLKELEKRAAAKGHHLITVAAMEAAEGFYLKCGYVPHLFVQAKPPLTLGKLRSLNKQYDEAWTYDDGKDIRLCLDTKGIDKGLQHKYDKAFPECTTQTLFTKQV
jgi:GNAT superfamily N-acetyltransferase